MFSNNSFLLKQQNDFTARTPKDSKVTFAFGDSAQTSARTQQNQGTLAQPPSNFLSSGTTPLSFPSLYPTTQLTNSTSIPSSTFSGFNAGTPFTNAISAQPQSLTPQELSLSNIPNEVQVVLSELSNADSRSCQLLMDVFQRLKSLVTDPPVFIAFTYELVPSPQVLSVKRTALEEALTRLNKSQIVETYNLAQKENPDSNLYAIVPVEGFSGIIQRCETQTQCFDQVNNLLQDLKTRQEHVRNHIEVQAMKRIEGIRQRHERLQSEVIDVVQILEDYAITHSMAQLDVAFLKRLKTDIAALSAEVYQSAVGRLRLNETALKLKDISRALGIDTGSPSATTVASQTTKVNLRSIVPDLSETSFKQITRILQKQDILLDNLATSLGSLALKSKKFLEFLEQTPDTVPRYARPL